MSAPARFTGTAARILGLIGQAGCVCCGGVAGSEDPLCAGCRMRLDRSKPRSFPPPPGIDRVHSVAEHSGVAREIVSALKYRRRLAAADVMAERMSHPRVFPLLGDMRPKEGNPEVGRGAYAALVPVPSAPWRNRSRGFNPAGEIAKSFSERLGLGVVDCLKRRGEGHQVGRGRGARRSPDFQIEVAALAPPSCLLIDDVYTTGGTLTACAMALRKAGAREVAALTFTRRP